MAIKKNSGPNKAPLTTDQIAEANSKMISRHVVQLEEYGGFDTVQIICTRCGSDGVTEWHSFGSGNDFARAKSLEMWLRDFHQAHG